MSYPTNEHGESKLFLGLVRSVVRSGLAECPEELTTHALVGSATALATLHDSLRGKAKALSEAVAFLSQNEKAGPHARARSTMTECIK
jgi:hypothetical protein